MERSVLRTLLGAGPTRKFDVLRITRSLDEPSPENLLFRLRFLNRSVIFKVSKTDEFRSSTREDAIWTKPIGTLIYMPYFSEQPEMGGEAFIYGTKSLERVCEDKGLKHFDPEDLAHDESILSLLADLPALNPFLLKDQFDRRGQRLPADYLRLDARTENRLRERLNNRVRPLIVAAFKGYGADLGNAINRLVDAFLKPSFNPATETLAAALRLNPMDAPEILSSWTGIAYFEDEVRRLHPDIREMAIWLSKNGRPRESLKREEAANLDRMVAGLRNDIREGWQQVRGLLAEYQATYESLIFEGDSRPFVRFLKVCRESYWDLGDLVGRFEQAVLAWRSYTKAHNGQALPFDAFMELVRFLTETHRPRELTEPEEDFLSFSKRPASQDAA